MGNPDIRIRPAAPTDIAAIANLTEQLGYAISTQEASTRLATVLQHPDHAAYVAETPANEVVGWIHVLSTCYLQADPFAEIGGLVVDERHRGAGVGKALLAAAESWARGQGYAYLRVRSNMVREGARAFYERMGYRWTKAQNVFARDLL